MVRKNPKLRKQEILEAAVRVAARDGYMSMQRIKIAEEAQCADGLIGHYWTMPQLRRSVLRYAVKNKVFPVIVQAIGNGDKYIKRISKELRQEALNSI